MIIAFADFNTLAMIAAYFAHRRGQGRPRDNETSKLPIFISLLFIWIYCFSLASLPFFNICGQYGYDPAHGRCHLLPCKKCSLTSNFSVPPSVLLEVMGTGVPTIVVIISYTLVYWNLNNSKEMEGVAPLKRAVLILSFSYFVFILPNALTGYFPFEVSKWAVIGTCLDCWYWNIYVVNFFI